MINIPLPLKIAQSLQTSVKFRTLSVQFGNGYEQVRPDGINNKYAEYNITWETLSQSQYNIVNSALYNAGSYTVIMWQPPGTSAPLKFRMTEDGYNVSYKAGDVYTISTTLKQVF